MTEQKSLVAKLCEVMALIPRIEKRGENTFQNYKYAMEADLVDVIRPLLADRKVFIFPNVISHNRVEHQAKSGTRYLTDIMVEWTFVDAESGEERTCVIPGCGEDGSDKGVNKAMTGSEKYMLMKSFLIATGDDPEKDDTEPAQPPTTPPLPTRPPPQRPPQSQPVNPPYQGPPPTASVNGGQVWQGQLMGVEAKTVTSKKTGQPYIIHEFKISLQDGIATAGAGFDEELADRGKLAVGAIIRAQIVPGQKRGFWTIQSFEVVG